MTPRIAAIILTYHPDTTTLGEAIGSLAPQVDRVLVVDNGTHWNSSALLENMPAQARNKIEFIWLEENVGVGAGHNRGIEWARARDFTHVLILDHDSVPRSDMVGHLSRALDTLAQRGIRVAAVGPNWLDRYTGRLAGFVRLGRWKLERVFCRPESAGELMETDFIISSGALIPMQILDDIGDMNEGFFIDHVDTEWVFRARLRGYRSFGVCNAIMEHSLGTAMFRFWLGRWRNVPLHSPERHYYVFRNSVLLLRMPHAPRRWIVNDIVRLISMVVVFPVFAPDRWRRIQLMVKGLWHGVCGVTGQLR